MMKKEKPSPESIVFNIGWALTLQMKDVAAVYLSDLRRTIKAFGYLHEPTSRAGAASQVYVGILPEHSGSGLYCGHGACRRIGRDSRSFRHGGIPQRSAGQTMA